ncbi:type I-E CRISPR-associated protein Cse1/CasA [Nocardiopsis quinghaiensis]|uniref:type I-E CRISPR-associated protein Cse1/CasA n=1 Tax=Nocardiopsis quinghaiensis TaxID=464995 RepID=UPI00123BCD2A|nr:type I-E CRISPR-associated protein Cse1/CasA [Nocardiopsis quinghaiensis]
MTSIDRLYHLPTEPCAPVRWRSNALSRDRPERVGIRDLLVHAHDIKGLAVPLPPAASALMRILYALALRITRLDHREAADRDGKAWDDRRFEVLDSGRFSEEHIDEYFNRYSDRLWLYHPERPFLQDPRLSEQCTKPAGVNKLITTRPSGGNHSWFSHASPHDPTLPTSDQALLHLLVWNYYGPSGTCAVRKVGEVSAGNTNAGPLRGTLSYHPEGESLFETLLAGLPRPSITVDPDTDLCPWEWHDLPDPLLPRELVTGPCSSLTARSQHALLLVPDQTGEHTQDSYVTWAYRNKLPRGDDYLIWQVSKEGNPYPRPAESDRALWRDLDALLHKAPVGDRQAQRPRIFSTAIELLDETPSMTMKVRALGFDQDGQAKDRQFVSASTPPVLDLMERRDGDVQQTRHVGHMQRLGELTGRRLDTATKRAWALYSDAAKISTCSWSRQAAARYWPAAETEFWRRLRTRNWDGMSASFRRIAERTYEEVTAPAASTARGARARETARIDLYGGRPKKKARTT